MPQLLNKILPLQRLVGSFSPKENSAPEGKHIYLEKSMIICPVEENGEELLELGWAMKSVAEPLARVPCMYGQKGLNK